MPSGNQFLGDMKLTDAQLQMFEGGPMVKNLAAVPRWPKTGDVVNIPYTLDPNNQWSEFEFTNLATALWEFKEKTCIRYSTLTSKTAIPDFTNRKCFICSYCLSYRR